MTETAICIVERWKKIVGYRFVPECNQVQKVKHVNFFAFSAIFAGPWFVEIQKFFFYHGNVTTAFKEKKLNVLSI